MAEFGSDFAGIGDFDAALAFVEGERCLAEALANRLLSAPGSLIDDPDYGYDLRSLLNETLDAPGTYGKRVERELLKDERVRDARVSLEFVSATGTVLAPIEVTTSDGPFRFVLSVSASSYDILFGP